MSNYKVGNKVEFLSCSFKGNGIGTIVKIHPSRMITLKVEYPKGFGWNNPDYKDSKYWNIDEKHIVKLTNIKLMDLVI